METYAYVHIKINLLNYCRFQFELSSFFAHFQQWNKCLNIL